jgi:hypothetical protein
VNAKSVEGLIGGELCLDWLAVGEFVNDPKIFRNSSISYERAKGFISTSFVKSLVSTNFFVIIWCLRVCSADVYRPVATHSYQSCWKL